MNEYTTNNTVTYLTHSFFLMNWSNHETTQMCLSKISNNVCLIKSLFNEQMFQKTTHKDRNHVVKNSACFFHWSNHELKQNDTY